MSGSAASYNARMFVHLRLHTEFSVVDGTNRIDEAVASASANRQPALAITDLSNLFGAVKFYKAARAKGVKPLLGAEIHLEGTDGAPSSRIVLLVQGAQGYLHLSELLARAWTRSASKVQALARWEWLQELGEGLIALSGAQAGPVGAALTRGDDAAAADTALRLARIFPHRFYLEVQRAGRADDEAHVVAAAKLAARLELPLVATHPVQFATADDYEAHEARVCIAEGEILGNARRVRRFTREQYFKTTEQMAERCLPTCPRRSPTRSRLPNAATSRSSWASRSCRTFPRPAACRLTNFSGSHRLKGWRHRLAHLYPDAAERESQRPRYVERLEFELQTILKMGFPGYFLIVGDFINWAKSNGCPVGPGRGSGAGSLVAYALKITDLDPLAIQAAVRAVSEPGAGVHARLRHRLLSGQPRPGDRLREGQIRQGRRQPDRHLWHHGRQGRHPRRGPGAWT